MEADRIISQALVSALWIVGVEKGEAESNAADPQKDGWNVSGLVGSHTLG